MPDLELSAAVVTFIWGDHSLPWPSTRPECLTASQRAHLPRIDHAIAVVFAGEIRHAGLNEEATERKARLRAAMPELTDEAVDAIGNYWAYCWK